MDSDTGGSPQVHFVEAMMGKKGDAAASSFV